MQFLDIPCKAQVDLQDPASVAAYELVKLNDTITFYLVLIAILVCWFTFTSITYSYWDHEEREAGIVTYMKTNIMSFLRKKEQTLLEVLWTILPGMVLILILVPSFKLLYQAEEEDLRYTPLHSIGHQWYWEYLYPMKVYEGGHSNWYTRFSPFVHEKEGIISLIASVDGLRLFAADPVLAVPAYTPIKFFVTGDDVIHSFAIPSLALKIDAVPGRINAITTEIGRESVMFGACSELCGINHGYMPIQVLPLEKGLFAEILRNS